MATSSKKQMHTHTYLGGNTFSLKMLLSSPPPSRQTFKIHIFFSQDSFFPHSTGTENLFQLNDGSVCYDPTINIGTEVKQVLLQLPHPKIIMIFFSIKAKLASNIKGMYVEVLGIPLDKG